MGQLRFDGFEIDLDACRLFRGGALVALERRTFDLLAYFVARPERLISRDELVAQVWHARALSEGVLASTVAKLRKALGQDPEAREPLETVRGRGYCWHGRARGADDPFVARVAALAQLSAALERAAAGAGQLVLVSGEAGMGKTRLLRELEKLARASEFSVWWGAGRDAVATPAWWPWVEVLRAAHLQLTEAGWRKHLSRDRSALAQLVPELCDAAMPDAPHTAQTLRFQLFDALTQFVQSCSVEAPRLIVIDDLHWADVPTLELLAYAAGVLERQRVLLVAALREHEIVVDPEPLQRLQRRAATVALEALTAAEVAELVAALDGDGALADGLFQRTEGNPLFVRETLRLLREQAGRTLAELELPPVVRGVIARRIALLPDDTQQLLAAAAVGGEELDAYVVAELLALPLEQVLRGLEPALSLRVVEAVPAAQAWQFVFAHALVRDELYASLGAARAGTLHGRLARVLERRGAAADARQLAAIAHHFLLAVPSELAASVAHGQAAAASTRATSGYEAAAAILARVVRKHESESDDLSERCELLLALANDLSCAGDVRAAWGTLRRGSELARQLGAAKLLARFAFALAPWLEHGGGDEAYVRALQTEALQALGDADDIDLRARLLAQHAQLETERSWSERSYWLQEAQRLASAMPTVELARQLTYARAKLRAPQHLVETQQAVERFRELDTQGALRYADPVRLREAISVELSAYVCALASCQLANAEAALARVRPLACEAHTMRTDFALDMIDAGRALASGELGTLEACVLRLQAASSGGGGFEITWMRYGVYLIYELGMLNGSLPLPSEHIPTMTALPGLARVEGELFLAWMHAQAEDDAAARRTLAGIAPELLARLPLRLEDLAPLCMLSETLVRLENRAGAERAFAQLEPFAALNAVGSTYDYLGSVAHFLGLLAAFLGRHADACRYFEQAEASNLYLGMPLQLARTRAALASVRNG